MALGRGALGTLQSIFIETKSNWEDDMKVQKRFQTKLSHVPLIVLIIAILVCILAIVFLWPVYPEWTGFGADPIPANTAITSVVIYQPVKALWDWLELLSALLVPILLAVVGYNITQSESKRTLVLQQQQGQDAALQDYFKQMAQLLIQENLRASQPEDAVRLVARIYTLTALRRVGSTAKGTILRFLFEAKLIGYIRIEAREVNGKDEEFIAEKIDESIVDLYGADLSGAILGRVNQTKSLVVFMESLTGLILPNVDMTGADLTGTDLRYINLQRTKLTGAKLHQSNLKDVDLRHADLSRTDLSGINLSNVKLLFANLQQSNLHQANLSGLDLSFADLTGADLTKANLTGAKLFGADLTGAKLSEAKLNGADLSFAILTNCKVTQEQLAQAASLESVRQ
jgi:uncharacterized protein YjbI with pentapeptide repeats